MSINGSRTQSRLAPANPRGRVSVVAPIYYRQRITLSLRGQSLPATSVLLPGGALLSKTAGIPRSQGRGLGGGR